MQAEQIMGDFLSIIEQTTSPICHQTFRDALTIAVRGQMTSMLLFCDAPDEQPRQAAMTLFCFFTLQAQAFATLQASLQSLSALDEITAFAVKNPEEFASDHKTLRDSGELLQFQQELANKRFADIQKETLDAANELQAKMIELVKPVEFDELIDDSQATGEV